MRTKHTYRIFFVFMITIIGGCSFNETKAGHNAVVRKSEPSSEFRNNQKASSTLDPCETPHQKAFDLYNQADADNIFLYFSEDATESIELLLRAVDIDPFYHAAYYALGRLYIKSGNYDRAESCFLKCMALKPRYLDAYKKLAAVYITNQYYKKAIGIYDLMISKGGKRGDVNYHKGNVYCLMEDFKQAEILFMDSIKDNSETKYSARLRLFEINLHKGRLNNAWEYLKASHPLYLNSGEHIITAFKDQLKQNNPYALLAAGRICYYAHDYSDAKQYFEKALRVDAARFDQYYELGMIYQTIKSPDYVKSKACLEKAIELHPDHYGINVALGKIYNLSESVAKYHGIKPDYKKALSCFLNARKMNHNNSELHLYIGRAYLNLGQYEKALEATELALSLKDNVNAAYREPYFSQPGDIFTERYEKALEEAGLALSLKDNADIADKWPYYSQIGDIYFKMNNYEASLENHQKSHTIKATPQARFRIVYALFQLKQYDDIIRFIKEVRPYFPDNHYLSGCLGDAYYAEKNYSLAIDAYSKYLHTVPADYRSTQRIGNCYFGLNDYENAIAWLKKANRLNPEETDALYYLGLTYWLVEEHEKSMHYFNKALAVNPSDKDVTNLLSGVQKSYEIKHLPDKLKKLAGKNNDIGVLSKLLLYALAYDEANNLWIQGNHETEYRDGQNIVSPKIFAAQRQLDTIQEDLQTITTTNDSIKEMADTLLSLINQKIDGIKIHSEGFYASKKDYMGQYEKGRAKIRIADKHYVGHLTRMKAELLKNESVISEAASEYIDAALEYYADE